MQTFFIPTDCPTCEGLPQLSCRSCGGTGGLGRFTCSSCAGRGWHPCETCEGQGQVPVELESLRATSVPTNADGRWDAHLAEEIREYLALADDDLAGYGLRRTDLEYQLQQLATSN